jgi:hypothetical protein
LEDFDDVASLQPERVEDCVQENPQPRLKLKHFDGNEVVALG